jgi:N-acetylglucosamine-6-sulfatase
MKGKSPRVIRRLTITATIAIALSAITLIGHQTRSDTRLSTQPNIVVIMVDDLDVAALNRLVGVGAMPYLQAEMIEPGVTFTNAFVTNPLCSPARATLLTGLYAHNHGVRTNLFDSGKANFDDRSTLATWLQAAGYVVAHVGKYLNGYGKHDLTGDGWVTAADRQYVPPGWNEWHALLDPYKMYDYRINHNRLLVKYGSAEDDYQTDVLARHAVQFIDDATRPERGGVPFYLQVMAVAPHVELPLLSALQSPWQWDIRPAPRHEGTLPLSLPRPPSFNEADVSDKPAWVQEHRRPMTLLDILGTIRRYRHRLESMRAVDDLIGDVVSALRRAAVLDNTVLIFTSDNGYLHGEHRMTEKLAAYEESIRVPLIVRVPWTSRASLSQVIVNNDLAPTIAELAGARPAFEVDGTSFVPLLRDGTLSWRRRFLIEHWQALPVLADTRLSMLLDLPTYWGVRTRDIGPAGVREALYLNYEDAAQTPEFYDLTTDPYQLESLHADADPRRVTEQQALATWSDRLRSCRGAQCASLEFAP